MLDRVFCPLGNNDKAFRQEPASIKTMKQGDATWTTSKVTLGWLIDTTAKTIALPSHRIERLLEIMESVTLDQRTVAIKDLCKVVGELRSMWVTLPGLVGLFSLLQEAFRHEDPTRPRLNFLKLLHGFLEDFRWLAKDVATRPTRIAELVPDPVPAVIGACDAAGTGMGGIHFIPSPDGFITPLLWQQHLLPWIQRQLVSFSNPDGTSNNSDLKLAGLVAHNNILAMAAEVEEQMINNVYNNTAAVFWQRKGAATTTGLLVYLLCLQALHQRYFHYVPKYDYIFRANPMSWRISYRGCGISLTFKLLLTLTHTFRSPCPGKYTTCRTR